MVFFCVFMTLGIELRASGVQAYVLLLSQAGSHHWRIPNRYATAKPCLHPLPEGF